MTNFRYWLVTCYMRQVIIWTNAEMLLLWPLGTKLNEILIEMHTFSLKKMYLRRSPAKWRPFCLGLNVLTIVTLDTYSLLHALYSVIFLQNQTGVFHQVQIYWTSWTWWMIYCTIEWTNGFVFYFNICMIWNTDNQRIPCHNSINPNPTTRCTRYLHRNLNLMRTALLSWRSQIMYVPVGYHGQEVKVNQLFIKFELRKRKKRRKIINETGSG